MPSTPHLRGNTPAAIGLSLFAVGPLADHPGACRVVVGAAVVYAAAAPPPASQGARELPHALTPTVASS